MWAFLGAFCFGCGGNGEESNPSQTVQVLPIKCTLKIDQSKSEVWADVSFENENDRKTPVLTRNLLEGGELTFAAFSVRHDGAKVAYNGISVKRGPFRKEDWKFFGPHEVYKTRVRIGSYYDISRAGKYEILYQAYNPDPYPDGPGLVKMQSNVETLTVRR